MQNGRSRELEKGKTGEHAESTFAVSFKFYERLNFARVYE